MPIRHFFLVLRARWLLLLAVMFGVVVLVGVVTYMLPRQYTANATIVLDAKSPDPVAGFVLPGMAMSGYIATQVDVLKSQRVALKVIDSLALDRNADARSAFVAQTGGRGEFRAWLAENLVRGLDVVPGRESNAINVNYTAQDPAVAAALTNAVVAAFVETTLEMKVEPARQYTSMFDERAKSLRKAVETAQTRLTEFQRDNGVTAKDERVDTEAAKLAELSSQFVAMQATTTESTTRQAQAASSAERMQEVMNNGVIGSLTTDLARQESKLGEMSARLGDNHPDVVQTRASIQQLRNRIALETTRVSGGVTVTNTINQSRLNQAREALEAQRSRVVSMRSQRDRALMLAKDVDNAQRAYDAIYTRADQTSLESQITQTNVSVLKRASAPAFPSQPRTMLNIAAAIVLGLMLGIGACVMREKLNPVLRSEFDVIESLNLGVLARVPRIKVPGERRAIASPAGMFRLAFGRARPN